MGYVLGSTVTVESQPGVFVRIHDDALKSVVFFGRDEQTADGDVQVSYRGTGFFARRQGFTYLFTARHVAQQLDGLPFVIRFNLPDGTSHPEQIDRLKWYHHTDPNVDVSVAFYCPPRHYDVVPIDTNIFIQEDWADDYGAGDEVQVVGLFRLVVGADRNLPFVHTGHIALCPTKGETIPLRDLGTKRLLNVEGYLIEVQTLDGISGSPVFARRSIKARNMEGPTFAIAYGEVSFLGLYAGSWDGAPGEILANDRGLNGPRVPVGMGVVVPAHKLLQGLAMPKMKAERQERQKKRDFPRAAVSDSAFQDQPQRNPIHKEDFNRLLDAAVRKPEQDDQT